MTQNPTCASPDTPLQELARLMAELDCGAIPIVDGHERRPVGLVTDRDIAIRVVAKGRNPLEMVARDCMSTPVVSVSPGDSIEDCCHAMEAHQVRRLAVVEEDGSCVGIVSQADLALNAPEANVGEVVKEVSRTNVTSPP
jgi:CBS domain-containing protein